MKLVIYMPALNEEEGIAEVIKSLPKQISQIDEIKILVVDDGSKDNTAQVAEESGAEVVSHKGNKGVGRAFQTALEYALETNTDILVSIDADRQFNSDQIPDVIKPLLDGKADMVTGNRFTKEIPEHMSSVKHWGNKQMSRLVSALTGETLRDVSCGFRAYNKEALLNLNLFGQFTYTQETIMDLCFKGLRVVEVPIEVIYYKERKSRVAGSIVKYATNTLKIILRTLVDYKPMLLFGNLTKFSFIITLLSLAIFLVQNQIQEYIVKQEVLVITGTSFFVVSIGLYLFGILAQMITRLRFNQEKILYQIKKNRR